MTFDIMKYEDVAEIAEIEKEAFPTHPWSENLFFDELKDDTKHYVVAHENGEVIAYGGFAQIFDEAHIMNIAVRKDFRSRGIGRRVLGELTDIADALGIAAMTLEVDVNNAAALGLYKSVGFISYGIRPDYYGKGEHAEILWRAMD